MFVSSRNSSIRASLREALLSPLASDGGLFCLPQIRPFENAQSLAGRPYEQVAMEVFKQLGLADGAASANFCAAGGADGAANPDSVGKCAANPDSVGKCVDKSAANSFITEAFAKSLEAYAHFDGGAAIARKTLAERDVIELWHGRTRAFKDLALAPLARFIAELAAAPDAAKSADSAGKCASPDAPALRATGEELRTAAAHTPAAAATTPAADTPAHTAAHTLLKPLIICATSGDTGPATLDAFEGRAAVVCLFPEGKTSAAQRAQMCAKSYTNSLAIGISGNFDDAQSALKSMLADAAFAEQVASRGYALGAANSLNFGRIIYQIIYHFYAAINAANAHATGASGYTINIPSGNFGNALGAFYARCLGAPIARIRVVTNDNCVLDDFFKTARYDLRGRAFKSTKSPAMDILRSSNLERLLFAFFGAERTAELYAALAEREFFELSEAEHAALCEVFDSAACSEADCLATIADVHAACGEILDPHTACAFFASQPGEAVAATAEWCKFAPSIAAALGEAVPQTPAQEADFIARFAPASPLAALIRSEANYAANAGAAELRARILAWL